MTPAIMDEVWEHSKTKGSPRLLLLAIAKHADYNSNTGAYPSLALLKHLTRLSHSQVCAILRQLEDGGHLHIAHGAGPNGTNLYTILRPWDHEERPKIGHAKVRHAKNAQPKIVQPKSAHMIGHPEIAPNLRPEEKTQIPVASSDMQSLRPSLDPADPDYQRGLRLHHEAGTSTIYHLSIPEPEPEPAPQLEIPLDPRYELGSLCHKGHRWQGTDQSLRKKKNRRCVACEREWQQTKRTNHAWPKERKAQQQEPRE